MLIVVDEGVVCCGASESQRQTGQRSGERMFLQSKCHVQHTNRGI